MYCERNTRCRVSGLSWWVLSSQNTFCLAPETIGLRFLIRDIWANTDDDIVKLKMYALINHDKCSVFKRPFSQIIGHQFVGHINFVLLIHQDPEFTIIIRIRFTALYFELFQSYIDAYFDTADYESIRTFEMNPD